MRKQKKNTKKPVIKNNVNTKTIFITKSEKINNNIKRFFKLCDKLISVIALIISIIAFSFSKQTSQLVYTYEINSNKIQNISTVNNNDITYNISNITVTIKNKPGALSKILIGYTMGDTLDIFECELNNNHLARVEDGFMMLFKCNKTPSEVTLDIFFNRIGSKNQTGYFFIIFKDYSGNYYYNLVHYITDDKLEYDDETGFYFNYTYVDFMEYIKIYDGNIMMNICDNINNKKYTEMQIDVNEYKTQIENDYKIMKEKIEG